MCLLVEVVLLEVGPHCRAALGMAFAVLGTAGRVVGIGVAAAVGTGAGVHAVEAEAGHKHRRVAEVVLLGCAKPCVLVRKPASVQIQA